LGKFNLVFSPEDEDGTNVILSRFPIVTSGVINLAETFAKPSGKVLWADIKIGDKTIKVYNCHFGIVGSGPRTRIESLKIILQDSKKYSLPTIICGDLNTTIPARGWKRKITQWFHNEPDSSLFTEGKYPDDDERYSLLAVAEQDGFQETTDINRTTWVVSSLNLEIFRLKLDYFLVKGLKANKSLLSGYISDHRSIFTLMSID